MKQKCNVKLWLLALIGFLPIASVWAEGQPAAAKWGETEYPFLQDAVNDAMAAGGEQTIYLIGEPTTGEVVTIQEVAGFKLTIDGKKDETTNYKSDAQIVIDGLRGNGGSMGNGASVTLQNIDFVHAANSDGIVPCNYPHDVTIQDCTYTGPSDVTDKWFVNANTEGPLYGVTIKNVTVKQSRLIQADLSSAAVFENIVATDNVYAGFNIKTNNSGGYTGTVLIKNCQVTTEKYAFRDYKDAYDGTITLEDNTFISTTSANDEGVIVNRGGKVGTAHINVVSGTYLGSVKVLNNKEGVLSVSGGTFTPVSGDEWTALDSYLVEGKVLHYDGPEAGTYTVVDGIYVAEVTGIKHDTFASAAEFQDNGEMPIKLLTDITESYTMKEEQTLLVIKNGKTLTVEAPQGFTVVESEPDEDGVTTYTLEAPTLIGLVFEDADGAEVNVPLSYVNSDEPEVFSGMTYKFTGQEIKPTFIGFKFSDNSVLKLSEHEQYFTVNYYNNTNAWTECYDDDPPYVKIESTDGPDTWKVYFEISPIRVTLEITCEQKESTYDGTWQSVNGFSVTKVYDLEGNDVTELFKANTEDDEVYYVHPSGSEYSSFAERKDVGTTPFVLDPDGFGLEIKNFAYEGPIGCAGGMFEEEEDEEAPSRRDGAVGDDTDDEDDDEPLTFTSSYGDVTVIPGYITINPVELTVTTASEEFTFNGEEHYNHSYEITSGELVEGEVLKAIFDESSVITNVAESPVKNKADFVVMRNRNENELVAPARRAYIFNQDDYSTMEPSENEDGESNYAITVVEGNLTMTSASFDIVIVGNHLDNKPYTNFDYCVTGYKWYAKIPFSQVLRSVRNTEKELMEDDLVYFGEDGYIYEPAEDWFKYGVDFTGPTQEQAIIQAKVEGKSYMKLKPEMFSTIGDNYDVNFEVIDGYIHIVYPATFLVNESEGDENIETINSAVMNINGMAEAILEGRTLYRDGSWNTICLPFDVDIESSPLAGGDARELNDAAFADGTLTLNFTEEGVVKTLKAGVPYIIKWAEGEPLTSEFLHFYGVKLSAELQDKTIEIEEGKSVTFKGTYSTVTFDEDNKNVLLVGAENSLYYPQAGAYLNAQRAYFQLEGIYAGEKSAEAAPAFVLTFGDATVINNVKTENATNEYFDLSGRRVAEPTTGIYIVNGKKIIVK